MAERFWYAPNTEEHSALGGLEIDSKLIAEVRIVHCVYMNRDSGFGVYDVEDNEHRWFKISGFFPAPLSLDAYYTIDGIVKEGKYGRVLQVSDYRFALPRDMHGIITVLRTLPGIDVSAPKIYDALGDDALKLIFEDPAYVASKLKRVGLQKVLEWQAELRKMRKGDIIVKTLQSYKIPPNSAAALLEKYPDIVERLERSPYFLVDELKNYGFKKCDRIALENGYPINGLERLQQAMIYVLEQTARRRGDCYMSLHDFMRKVNAEVEIAIDFRTAVKLLSRKGDIQFGVGERQFPIDRETLERAIECFRKSPGSEGTFCFVCSKPPDEEIGSALEGLLTVGKVVLADDDSAIYLGPNYKAETRVASRLVSLAASKSGKFESLEAVVEQVCEEESVALEQKQREAVLKICESKGGAFVLNGRAGCGKTFTLNIVLKVLKKAYRLEGKDFTAKIMAPTGKAVRVISQATGMPAQTIHRALHLVSDRLEQDNAGMNCDCVIIDEFSMVGIRLAAAILMAVSDGTKVVIMGDYEQLPSIEAGNVLRDIISSGCIPVLTLDVVRRQAEGSGILCNANKIIEGRMIHTRITNQNGLRNNAYIYRVESNSVCRNKIVEMVLKLRSAGYSLEDIQVICPQKKTDVGIDSINYFLQTALNPPKGMYEVPYKTIKTHDKSGKSRDIALMFREGDKVINTANNYTMKFFRFRRGEGFVEDYSRVGIVNGETGRIVKIIEQKIEGKSHQRIYVQYGKDQYAMYEDAWDDLSLAYAMTVHRAQGSQWPVVIAPIMSCNRGMLTRNLFYTLYTRAQDVCILFGTEEAIQYAVENNTGTKRNTRLTQRLRAEGRTREP